jgi:hypothetical protein
VETLLAAQMAEIHVALMRCARQLAQADDLMQLDIAERALKRLARTFAAQMAALTHYRIGGDQKVTVQQVSVSDAGKLSWATRHRPPSKSALEKLPSPILSRLL